MSFNYEVEEMNRDSLKISFKKETSNSYNQISKLYLIVYEDTKWEDIQIFTSEKEAMYVLEQIKQNAPNYKKLNYRIETFERNGLFNNFTPNYINIRL
jgi:hypothetical protein